MELGESSLDEKFIMTPGVAEIRYISDDPEFHCPPPEDLYFKQFEGLGSTFRGRGNSDNSVLLSYFSCNLCQCDFPDVPTLKDHCMEYDH